MVKRHHDNAELCPGYEATLQYRNEFKVSVGFVSVSRIPERIENPVAQTGLQSTKD
jgi:hypothetical protein